VEQRALHVRSTWSGVKGAQWCQRVRIVVRASGGPSMMCYWYGLLTLVKIELQRAEPMKGYK
jgi:hypothetical protein